MSLKEERVIGRRGFCATASAACAKWFEPPTTKVSNVYFGLSAKTLIRFKTSSITGNWQSDPAGALVSNVQGDTRLLNVWAQDAWTFDPRWKAVLGVRAEQ